MAKVISIIHLKGGVGKSTIAVNLAHAFKAYTNVAVIDLDRQGSITDTAEALTGVSLVDDIGQDYRQMDFGAVIIDTPPYITDQLPHVLGNSDLVIIPTKAGVYDIIAAGKTVKMVQEAANKGLKAVFLLNMVNPRTSLTSAAIEQLSAYQLPILKTTIGERQDFIRSAAAANGIYSTASKKGIKEMDSLTKEILFLLQ